MLVGICLCMIHCNGYASEKVSKGVSIQSPGDASGDAHGRAKDITSEKMENILSIHGAMMDIAMQPKMVLLYAMNGKRLTESSTISIMEKVF